MPDDIRKHFDTAVEEVKSLIKQQDDEIKQQGKANEATGEALQKATSRMDEIKTEMNNSVLEAQKDFTAQIEKLEARLQRPGGDLGQEAKTIGQMFTESEQYKNASAAGRRSIDAVMFDSKNLSNLAASAGALTRPMRRDEIIRDPADRPMFVRQLFRSLPISDGAIEIMRENVFTNNAAPQQPASANSALGAGEFEDKPQSNITYELQQVNVKTMAHWMPASRQVLNDIPRLRGEIDGRLMYGLQLINDAQLLYGDGTNQNLTGIFTDSGLNDLGMLASGTTGDDIARAMIDHVRKGVTLCQLSEYYNVNGLVINPQDWETVELAKGSDGHYIWVSVPNGGETRMWRVPVVVTNAVQPNDFALGDWQMAATVYDREQMSIRVSEHHDKLFIQNAVALLAEERLGFGIERPKALTKGSFEVAP